MSCLLCPSSHLVIAASCTRHSSLRPSVSLHAAALHHARSHRHADYCVPSTALARACICSCPAAACSFRFHPSRTLPKNDLSCFICFTTFGHHRRSLHCTALHLARVCDCPVPAAALSFQFLIPAGPSRPSLASFILLFHALFLSFCFLLHIWSAFSHSSLASLHAAALYHAHTRASTLRSVL